MRTPGRTAAPAVVIAALFTLVLTGCAATSTFDATPPPETSSRTAAPPATALATADADVAFGPAPAETPSCDTILPVSAARRAVPGVTGVDRTTQRDVRGDAFFLAAAGGLQCDADDGTSPLVTDDDHRYQGVVVTVLPGAAAAHAVFRSEQLDRGPTDTCDASDSAMVACAADAVVGNAWVSVSVVRVQDSADVVPEALTPVVEQLLATVTTAVSATSLAHATADDTDRPIGPTRCSVTRVNAVTSTPLADVWARTDYQRDALFVAQARADADWCEFAASGSGERAFATTGAVYSALPDGGWVVQRRLAAGAVDRSDRLDLPGLDDSDGAWRTCDAVACSVDVVHDAAWTHFVLLRAVAPDTSAAVERWVRSSWRP